MKLNKVAVIVVAALPLLSCAAFARNCELPHEKIQYRCGGDQKNMNVDANALSGIQKPKEALKEIMADYRRKVEETGAVVEKANADYEAWVNTRQ